MSDWYQQSENEVLEKFHVTKDGHTSEMAAELLEKKGENVLEGGKKKSTLQVFLSQFADLLVIILIIAAGISMFTGNQESTLVIVAVIILNAILGTVQHKKAEKSLDSLKSLSSPTAKVMRDGQKLEIPSKDVVPGDILLLEAGDLVVADGRILNSYSLQVNESSLTGESTSVDKSEMVIEGEVPLADRVNMVYSSSLVTYGRAEQADYRETGFELLRTHDFLGVKFHVTGKDEMDVKVNMPGEFSVYNALAALAVGKVLGLPDQAIHDGLGKCVVKGRVELVPISKKFTILLDYAHNEVSTESLLTTLRAYKPHRLVVVFGCGGNRSKLRRYGMGEICAKMADFSILTEDNNRFEKVEDIIADIREGMNKGNPDAKFVEIPDRLDALHYAVDHAQEGDLIAVIGKGHETYRDREGVKTPFLERELLEEYAQQIGLE